MASRKQNKHEIVGQYPDAQVSSRVPDIRAELIGKDHHFDSPPQSIVSVALAKLKPKLSTVSATTLLPSWLPCKA